MKHLFLFFFTTCLLTSANALTAIPMAPSFKNVETGAHTLHQSTRFKKIIAKASAAKPVKNPQRTAVNALILGLTSASSWLLFLLGIYLLSPLLTVGAIVLGIIFGIVAAAKATRVLQEKDLPEKHRLMAKAGRIAGVAGALIMALITLFIIILLNSI